MKPTNAQQPPPPPATATTPVRQLRQLLDGIARGRYRRVIIMAGAGISTAAGIPDFRSPKTGLYDNLQRLNLPYPEAVFDISYLRKRPEAFFMLAEEMYPTQFKPTTFHRLVKWISDRGALKRVYTQNIDTLERLAGVPGDEIVEAHGSFAAVHCIDCGAEADKDAVEQLILSKQGLIPRCARCNGIVKHDIVFFGEALPRRFFDLQETDFDDVDLAIVAGSSLQVSPFNQLPDLVPPGVPRVLLNLERVGSLGRRKQDDVLVLGKLEELDPLFEEYISGTPVSTSKGPTEIPGKTGAFRTDSKVDATKGTKGDASTGTKGAANAASTNAGAAALKDPAGAKNATGAEDAEADTAKAEKAKDGADAGARESTKEARPRDTDAEAAGAKEAGTKEAGAKEAGTKEAGAKETEAQVAGVETDDADTVEGDTKAASRREPVEPEASAAQVAAVTDILRRLGLGKK